MTISSILSGLPVFKALQNNQPSVSNAPAQSEKVTTEDVVEISNAATQRLAQETGTKELSSDDLESVRNFAQETADLVADSDFSLGLDPDFDS